MVLWLWHRLAAAVPIQPLAWEFPYATGAAIEKKLKIPSIGTLKVPIAALKVPNIDSK